jgi:hypothetical protein
MILLVILEGVNEKSKEALPWAVDDLPSSPIIKRKK